MAMADPHDINAARQTYDAFIGTLKWAVPLIAAITAFVIWLIA